MHSLSLVHYLAAPGEGTGVSCNQCRSRGRRLRHHSATKLSEQLQEFDRFLLFYVTKFTTVTPGAPSPSRTHHPHSLDPGGGWRQLIKDPCPWNLPHTRTRSSLQTHDIQTGIYNWALLGLKPCTVVRIPFPDTALSIVVCLLMPHFLFPLPFTLPISTSPIQTSIWIQDLLLELNSDRQLILERLFSQARRQNGASEMKTAVITVNICCLLGLLLHNQQKQQLTSNVICRSMMASLSILVCP